MAKKDKIKAADFDSKLEDGDILEHLELQTAKLDQPTHRINIDIPVAILKKVDKEADRIGVPRTSLIKVWLAERVDRLSS